VAVVFTSKAGLVPDTTKLPGVSTVVGEAIGSTVVTPDEAVVL
jgi:hypothetical protein